MKNTLEAVFNFLFYLAFVRLFFCTLFFPQALSRLKLDRPLETCQSKGENSSSISIFKKKL